MICIIHLHPNDNTRWRILISQWKYFGKRPVWLKVMTAWDFWVLPSCRKNTIIIIIVTIIVKHNHHNRCGCGWCRNFKVSSRNTFLNFAWLKARHILSVQWKLKLWTRFLSRSRRWSCINSCLCLLLLNASLKHKSLIQNISLVHKLKPPTFGFCKTFQLFIGFSKVFQDVKPTSCLNPA